MKISNTLRSAVFLGSLMLASNLANAAVVSYSASFNISDSVSSGANSQNPFSDSLNNSQILSLPKFNTSLGALNSVTVEYLSVAQRSEASASFKDGDAFHEVAGLQNLSSMRVTSDLFNLGYSRNFSNRSDTCTDGPNAFTSAACNTSINGFTSFTGNSTTVLTAASYLAAATGTGSLLPTIRQFGTMFVNETDGDDGYIDNRFGFLRSTGTVRITYDYTEPSAVPVPAAAWLFSSALIAIAGVKRRAR